MRQEPRPEIIEVNGGTFQAVPVSIEESSCDEQMQTRNNFNFNTKSCPNRKMVLDSMLKAENISKDSFARIDMVRNHRLQDIKDFDETKKRGQLFQTSEMEKRQQEFQNRKTKDEEELQKRNEFPQLSSENETFVRCTNQMETYIHKIPDEVQSVKKERYTNEDIQGSDKLNGRETHEHTESTKKQQKGEKEAVTEAQHLPEKSVDVHKDLITNQEEKQVLLLCNPLEDCSDVDNDIS